jgi:hypothetical protein
VTGILQVLLLRECENYVLKCHKKQRMPREKRKRFPKMQSVEWNPRKMVFIAGRLIVIVRKYNDSLRRRSNVPNAEILIAIIRQNNDRLRRRSKVLNAGRQI